MCVSSAARPTGPIQRRQCRWLLIQQLSRLWRWGGRLGGRATGEERAGDSRGVALAVELIVKKRKNIIRHGLEPPPGNKLHTTTNQKNAGAMGEGHGRTSNRRGLQGGGVL